MRTLSRERGEKKVGAQEFMVLQRPLRLWEIPLERFTTLQYTFMIFTEQDSSDHYSSTDTAVNYFQYLTGGLDHRA